jgi:hypothetical protein
MINQYFLLYARCPEYSEWIMANSTLSLKSNNLVYITFTFGGIGLDLNLFKVLKKIQEDRQVLLSAAILFLQK